MSAKTLLFTALASNASAEQIAQRIGSIVSLVPQSEENFRRKFVAIEDAKNLQFPHSEASATLHMKETLEAAAGKRQISQFLRRFLTSASVHAAIDEQTPAYATMLAQQNGIAVAKAAATLGKDVSNVPEKASFRKRGVT